MTWSISISQEGWACLYRALEKNDREWLMEAIENDMVAKFGNWPLTFKQQNMLFRHLSLYNKFASHESLVDICYHMLIETNTCENGGHEYWVDCGGYSTILIADGEE